MSKTLQTYTQTSCIIMITYFYFFVVLVENNEEKQANTSIPYGVSILHNKISFFIIFKHLPISWSSYIGYDINKW